MRGLRRWAAGLWATFAAVNVAAPALGIAGWPVVAWASAVLGYAAITDTVVAVLWTRWRMLRAAAPLRVLVAQDPARDMTVVVTEGAGRRQVQVSVWHQSAPWLWRRSWTGRGRED